MSILNQMEHPLHQGYQNAALAQWNQMQAADCKRMLQDQLSQHAMQHPIYSSAAAAPPPSDVLLLLPPL